MKKLIGILSGCFGAMFGAKSSGEQAWKKLEALTVGDVVQACVIVVKPGYALLETSAGVVGKLGRHAYDRPVTDLSDVLSYGQELKVSVTHAEPMFNRYEFAPVTDVLQDDFALAHPIGAVVTGTVTKINNSHVVLKLADGCHASFERAGSSASENFEDIVPGDEIRGEIDYVSAKNRFIRLVRSAA